MTIELNYVSMQNGTMFYLLDLVDLWIIGLNFKNMMLSQPNLIRVKKRHFHHQTHVKICLLSLICLGR
jgi:type IV secretory pathway TrbD component